MWEPADAVEDLHRDLRRANRYVDHQLKGQVDVRQQRLEPCAAQSMPSYAEKTRASTTTNYNST